MYKNDFLKIFKEECENKYRITKRFGRRLGITEFRGYANLERLFLEGYENNFFLVPSIPSYIKDVYGYNNIKEWFLEEFGEEDLQDFQKKYGKINEKDIYIFLNFGNGCIPEFEKYNGNIIDTINKLFIKVFGYSKNQVPMYYIEKCTI